jgi:hypothetical protein
MRMVKYRSRYFTIFNMLDLCSIILGIIAFTLISLVRIFGILANGISNEAIIILTTVTILLLWIELVCFDDFYSTLILMIFKLITIYSFQALMVSIIFSNCYKYIYIWEYFKKDYTIFCIYVHINNRIWPLNVILFFFVFILV